MDASLLLEDRVCDATNRIPTARYPLFSTTEDRVIAIAGTGVDVDIPAERDLLLDELSVSVTNAAGATIAATVSLEYCDTVYMRDTNAQEWDYCCDRKPIFLVGVKDNKRLRFRVDLAVPAIAAVNVAITVSGIQGKGCCG